MSKCQRVHSRLHVLLDVSNGVVRVTLRGASNRSSWRVSDSDQCVLVGLVGLVSLASVLGFVVKGAGIHWLASALPEFPRFPRGGRPSCGLGIGCCAFDVGCWMLSVAARVGRAASLVTLRASRLSRTTR